MYSYMYVMGIFWKIILGNKLLYYYYYLSNIWETGARDRTSGQPQVKMSILRSISLEIHHCQHSRTKSKATFHDLTAD
jgi:hypothetical protein